MLMYNPAHIQETFSHTIEDMDSTGSSSSYRQGPRANSQGVRGNRRHMSGGMVFGDPLERVQDLAGKLRYRLMKLQDFADDLQTAIEDCVQDEDDDQTFSPKREEETELTSRD